MMRTLAFDKGNADYALSQVLLLCELAWTSKVPKIETIGSLVSIMLGIFGGPGGPLRLLD